MRAGLGVETSGADLKPRNIRPEKLEAGHLVVGLSRRTEDIVMIKRESIESSQNKR